MNNDFERRASIVVVDEEEKSIWVKNGKKVTETGEDE